MLEALHLVRGKATDLIDELSGTKRRQFKRRAVAQALRAQVPAGHRPKRRWAQESADVGRYAREDAGGGEEALGRKAEERLAACKAHRDGHSYGHGFAVDDGRVVAPLPNGFQRGFIQRRN